MNNDNNYLDSDSNKSTMRLVLMIVTIVVCFILLVTAVTAIILVLMNRTVDWYGMSAFIGAITLILGTVITGKVSQKGIEKRK